MLIGNAVSLSVNNVLFKGWRTVGEMSKTNDRKFQSSSGGIKGQNSIGLSTLDCQVVHGFECHRF
jgi:hypothetical protein